MNLFINLTYIQVDQIFFVLELMHEKSIDQIKVFSMDARKIKLMNKEELF